MCFKPSENKIVREQLTVTCIGNLFFFPVTIASQATVKTKIPKSGISKVQHCCVVHLNSRSEKHAEEDLLLIFSSSKGSVILVLLVYSRKEAANRTTVVP